MTKRKKPTANSWIDPDDAPELTREWFEGADFYVGDTLIKRGRPKKAVTANSIAIRLAPEVEKYFRGTGKGWQSRINKVLKDWVSKHA